MSEDDELIPYDLTAEPKAYVFLSPGWDERLKALTPRSNQVDPVDAVPPEMPGLPPWTPLRDNIPRRPTCRCSVLPTEGDYCNICENFPCLGGHPPGAEL